MKQIYFIMLLLAFEGVYSQNNRELLNNFSKDESNIITWQNISETNLSQSELIDAVVESGLFKDITVTANKIVCDLYPYLLNYGQFGFSSIDALGYLTENLITGTVIIELKGSRYLTKIKNIRLIQNIDVGVGVVSTLEYHVLNKQQELKFSSFKTSSDILNKDFLSKTTFKKEPEIDW